MDAEDISRNGLKTPRSRRRRPARYINSTRAWRKSPSSTTRAISRCARLALDRARLLRDESGGCSAWQRRGVRQGD